MGVEAAPGWAFDPALIGEAAVISGAYALRARALARRGNGMPAWRQACFHAGIVVLLLALLSPIDSAGETHVFYLHMVQHLLLGDLAPLLIVLGLSGPMVRPLLVFSSVRRLRVLANPLVALPLWAVNLYLWHLPGLYQAALAHEGLHALEHFLFFATGMAMWAAVIEPLPGPSWFGAGAKAAYVLGVRVLGAVLASVFLWAGTPLYPYYADGERLWGISPLTDQAIGGGIMFVWGAVVTLAAFVWLFLRWARESELHQELLDSGAQERVASRTARYGRRALDPPRSAPSPSAPRRRGR